MPQEKKAVKRGSTQTGQTLLEFALVVLFLVVVLVGIIDFSRFFFSYGTLANAAREGARYGIIYPRNVDGGDSPDPNNIMYRARERLGLNSRMELFRRALHAFLGEQGEGLLDARGRRVVELRRDHRPAPSLLAAPPVGPSAPAVRSV